MHTPRATKMWIATGEEKDGHWIDIPEPNHFGSNGFAQIEGYISRMLRSIARFTSVIISTPDQQVAVTLWQRGGVVEISLGVDWRSKPEQERVLRQFFAERGLSTSRDHLSGNGNVPDATLCLGYFLPPDAQFITLLTKDVLLQIYRVREGDALDFSYQEHHHAV